MHIFYNFISIIKIEKHKSKSSHFLQGKLILMETEGNEKIKVQKIKDSRYAMALQREKLTEGREKNHYFVMPICPP